MPKWFQNLDQLLTHNRTPAPPLLTMDLTDPNAPLPPNVTQFRSPPFDTAAGPNAPSGLPPYGVVPVVPATETPVTPTVETPVPIAPEPTQDEKLAAALASVGPDVSVSTPRATKAEKAAVAERVKLSKEKENVESVRRDEETSKARELAELAVKEQVQAERQAAEAEQRKQAAEEYARARSADLDAKRMEFEKNGTIRDMFGGDSAKRVQANLMTGIGAFASARGSGMPNLAGENIARELKEWQAMELSRIARDKDLLNMAREDREKAMADARLEVRNAAAAMAAVAAKERANILASHGVAEANIASDETILKLRDEREKMIQENELGLRSTVKSSNATQQDIKKEIAKSKIDDATGKLQTGKKQAAETVSSLAYINTGIDDVERIKQIIKENPKALEDYQRAHQSWNNLNKIEQSGAILRTGMGGARLLTSKLGYQIPTSEEQMMPNKEALELHTRLSNLTTGIAKSYGGVITDSDRVSAGSRVAILATGDPEASIKVFDEIGNEFKARRELYRKNTGADIPLSQEETKRRNAELMERVRRNPLDQQAKQELLQLRSAMAR